MSFGTYARRTRDRDRSHGDRYCALRCAVSRYCPIGFTATWSFLSTYGDLKRDEAALIRALDVLETSRAVWLADLDAFAARRRIEKQQHRRTPSASDRRRFRGYRWPGPDGHAAVLHAVEREWAAHLGKPFPETPVDTKGDLVDLDSTIAGCVSSYLSRGGELGPGDADLLLSCLGSLDKQLRVLGYPRTEYHVAFTYFLRLRKLTELVLNDASELEP